MTQYNPATSASVTATARKILLPMIRKVYPTLLAQSIVGVQPIEAYGPGSVFTLRASYTPEPKYKFSRAKWYEADISWNHYREVIEWCTEQFGPRPKVSDAWSRWFDNHGDRIFFRDEQDYLMFLLRWGQ